MYGNSISTGELDSIVPAIIEETRSKFLPEQVKGELFYRAIFYKRRVTASTGKGVVRGWPGLVPRAHAHQRPRLNGLTPEGSWRGGFHHAEAAQGKVEAGLVQDVGGLV